MQIANYSFLPLIVIPLYFGSGSSILRLETRIYNDSIADGKTSQSDGVNVERTLGLITLNHNVPYSRSDTIKLVNADGSLWFKFSFIYDDSDGKYDFENPSFRPFEFNPDYLRLGLVVTKKVDNNSFEVIVNHDEALRKNLVLEKYLIFQSWEDHVLSALSVDTDQHANPIFENSSTASKSVEVKDYEFLEPVEIKGDWLRIKWESNGKPGSGWIRWKKNGILIIGLIFYA